MTHLPAFTLDELAKKTNTSLVGDPAKRISGVSDLEGASENEVSFLANSRYMSQMLATNAGCVVIGKEVELQENRNFLISENPSHTFQQLIELFYVDVAPRSGFSGIHPSAVVHPEAIIEEGVTLAPHAVVDAKAHIGRGAFIGSNAYIGPQVTVGEYSTIYPNVVIR
jgi:UDP-3-O-[3-hydroxymyristoyl] glucosamine N-acyltransferase